jgi:hypothetical protein
MVLKTYHIIRFLILGLLYSQMAYSGITVEGELTHEKHALPGETYSSFILVSNSGETQATVRIYQKDYFFSADGSNYYNEPGTGRRSNADWVVFSPKQVVIPAGEKIAVNFTITVPQADTLAGTYWSLVMIEEIPEIEPEAIAEKTVGVRTILRYAVQLITHVGDTGVKELRFLGTKLVKTEKGRSLEVSLENVGERLLRPAVYVELFNLNGEKVGKFAAAKRRTYPGTSICQRIDLSDIASGTYKALVVADCGGDDIFGINYTLKIEE